MIQLMIPESYWREAGPDDDRTVQLLTTIEVLGTMHHLSAYAIKDPDIDEAGEQCSVNEQYSCFEDVHAAMGDNQGWETVEIKGRTYVLVMTPFTT